MQSGNSRYGSSCRLPSYDSIDAAMEECSQILRSKYDMRAVVNFEDKIIETTTIEGGPLPYGCRLLPVWSTAQIYGAIDFVIMDHGTIKSDRVIMRILFK